MQKWFRRASLVVPALCAAGAWADADLHGAFVAPTLLMLGILMFAVLVMRFGDSRRDTKISGWDSIDVLTPSGVSMMWLSAGALVLASEVGWASLSVIGVLGMGTTFVAITWTVLAGSAPDRWRGSKIERTIVPAIASEGDPLREELLLTGVNIPFGMRLFATGRVMRHGVISRYVLGREGAHGEMRLQADIGLALRGEHHAPAMELWFGDALGLTRTASVAKGEATLVVTPRLAPVDGTKNLLGEGGDASTANETNKFPTEGTFRIREYVPGDDTRRIHWVRSAQQDELIMRLPDEIPPADPAVRLVLDTELMGMEDSVSRAPSELLDGMVRVWLGIAKDLSSRGIRVTLVTAVAHNGTIQRVERSITPRTMRAGMELGTRARWQSDVSLDKLVDTPRTRHLVVTCRPRRTPAAAPLTWIVVPENVWTSLEIMTSPSAELTHQFPLGSEDNRRANRKAERERLLQLTVDRQMLISIVGWTHWNKVSGTCVARPVADRIQLAVIP
ncbi:MAG TPA: DUF58 domain-containing protein [Kofleriaceae bacterium]|jgi:uncharacterized protein (DUF58 family)